MSTDELAAALKTAIQNDPAILDVVKQHMDKRDPEITNPDEDRGMAPSGLSDEEISKWNELRELRDSDPLNSDRIWSMMRAWPEWYMENYPDEYDKYWKSWGLPERPGANPDPWRTSKYMER